MNEIDNHSQSSDKYNDNFSFKENSIKVNTKLLALKEKSGFEILGMSGELSINSNELILQYLEIETQETDINGDVRLSYESFNAFNNFLNNPLIIVVLVSSLWALWYHFCTGLRHLYWDMGYGYNLKSVTISGWVAVVCSFLFTFLTLLFFIS